MFYNNNQMGFVKNIDKVLMLAVGSILLSVSPNYLIIINHGFLCIMAYHKDNAQDIYTL